MGFLDTPLADEAECRESKRGVVLAPQGTDKRLARPAWRCAGTASSLPTPIGHCAGGAVLLRQAGSGADGPEGISAPQSRCLSQCAKQHRCTCEAVPVSWAGRVPARSCCRRATPRACQKRAGGTVGQRHRWRGGRDGARLLGLILVLFPGWAAPIQAAPGRVDPRCCFAGTDSSSPLGLPGAYSRARARKGISPPPRAELRAWVGGRASELAGRPIPAQVRVVP